MKKQVQQLSIGAILLIAGVSLLFGVIGFAIWKQLDYQNSRVSDYAACVKSAGSFIQESYPEVCVTRHGQRFTNPQQEVHPIE